MGVFDLFGKEPKTRNERTSRFKGANNGIGDVGHNGPVSVFTPTSYEDVELIIDAIRDGKNAVVHLNELTQETSLRILDMLSGAIYALGGGVYEMSKNIFMFSPSGVEVK
ncbi:MAG: cell division protein SepF [Clostridiales bacterium]|nr:cell division protein SepF [Clostridiales bacterium]